MRDCSQCAGSRAMLAGSEPGTIFLLHGTFLARRATHIHEKPRFWPTWLRKTWECRLPCPVPGGRFSPPGRGGDLPMTRSGSSPSPGVRGVYLDCSAATLVTPELLSAMLPYFSEATPTLPARYHSVTSWL